MQKVEDPKGQTTMYAYDGLGRLRKINYGVVNGVPAFSISYTLDANGNMTAMSDRSGSTSWSYDENNQRTSESRTQNSKTKTATYGYYANGQLKTLTNFDGLVSTLGYDAALRLVSQTDPSDIDANGNPRPISFGYDTRSRRTSITYPSGVSEVMTYDTGGRVSTITLQKSDGTKLQSFEYQYGFNANGRTTEYHKGLIRSVTELDGAVTSYGYDALDRLVAATRTETHAYNETYEYDPNDNRTKVVAGSRDDDRRV